MKLETFFSNFELFADAPNGVQKLRELILQLAVQGKLVPQNPEDEPAAVLLEKIKEEKERLVKEGKIKKSKKLPSVDVGEMAFDLPEGWEWVYLGQISNDVHYGYTASANHDLIDVRLLRITDIQNNNVNWLTVPGCEIEPDKLPKYELNKGDLLIARTGGTIGKSYLVENLSVRAVFASYLIRIIPTNPFLPKYLKLFLESELYWNQLYAKSMGTGQPNVNATSLKSLIIPLPPLNEQHRIVTKVDALMKLCDELETRSQNKRDRILKLGEVATTKLLTPTTKESFNQHWKTISDNFDLLYSTPENVKQLRQAILQLAVMGKLVPQNPDDEPAAVLLEKIKAEKERLVKEGKVKKSKELPPVDVGEMAFDLPQGWEWVRWENVAFQIGDVDHKMPQQAEDGIPYVSPRDFTKEGDIDFSAAKKISIEDFEQLRQKIQPQRDDIIFPRYGTIGVNRYVNTDIDFLASYSCAVIKNFSGFISPKYSYYYSISLLAKSEITKYINQTTQANVGVKSIQNFIFPLPPLNEQHRIVTKVNQMMSLCDELEAKLTQSIGDREKLMSAAVRQVLAV